MKNVALMLSLLLFSSLSYAEYFVCYSYKEPVRGNNGRHYVKYNGCYKSEDSCGSNGSEHFGGYPNRKQQNSAYKRCLKDTPRFVD